MWKRLSLDHYGDSLEALQHRVAFFLYDNIDKKLSHTTFRRNCSKTKLCTWNDHVMKRSEKKSGDVMMIFDICCLCGFGYAEVFPIKVISEKVILSAI